MSLAELLAELSSSQERLWTILQFWSSVSSGLIIAVYVIDKKVQIALTYSVLFVYSAYTYFCLVLLIQAGTLIEGLVENIELELNLLESQQNVVSPLAEGFRSGWQGYSPIPILVAYLGLYFLAAGFTLYRQHGPRDKAAEE